MIKVLLLIIVFFTGCASSNNKVNQLDQRFCETLILNYEKTNKYYVHQVRRDHFLLNIEIKNPVIIKIPKVVLDNIYVYSGVTGSSIIRFKVNNKGKVIVYSIKKRAGLGLDLYIKKIIKCIEIKPLFHRGEKGNSEFDIRFVFKSKGVI